MESEPSTTAAGIVRLATATRRSAANAASQAQEAAVRESDADPAAAASQPVHLRHPRTWSRDESFMRQARWCGFSREPWTKTELGGSDVRRRLNVYAADLVSAATQKGCNKYQKSHINLVPGIMLYWCSICERCIGFSVMDSAESVRMPFEFMYTSCEAAPEKFQMDNVCNLDQYIRNREPEFFAGTELLIDEAHLRSHVTCSENYNTRACNFVLQCNLHLDSFYGNACAMQFCV